MITDTFRVVLVLTAPRLVVAQRFSGCIIEMIVPWKRNDPCVRIDV
jgi:hypothetical protein